MNEKQTKLSEWFSLMRSLFNEAISNLNYPLAKDDFNLLIAKMIEILKCNVPTDDLEETLISYLSIFPHHIQHIQDGKMSKIAHHC